MLCYIVNQYNTARKITPMQFALLFLALIITVVVGEHIDGNNDANLKKFNSTYVGFKILKDGSISGGVKQEVCVFDRVAIEWHVPFSLYRKHCEIHPKNSLTLNILMKGKNMKNSDSDKKINNGASKVLNNNDNKKVFATYDLCTEKVKYLIDEQKDLVGPPKLRQVVWCALDEDLCNEPKVASAFATGWFGELTDNSPTSLIITFDQPTDMPDVSNESGIDNILSFSENIGQNYSGTWVNEKVLKLVVTNQTGSAQREKLKIGTLAVRLRKKVIEIPPEVLNEKWAKLNESIVGIESGMLNVRFSNPGSFSLVLHSSADPMIIATAPSLFYSNKSVSAKHCKNEVILAENLDDDTIRLGKSSPYYNIRGVISINGDQGITLPPHVLPDRTFDSWTIQMWVYLMEDSTGQHRALFFKGPNPNDGHRTPSVWLHPHSRHLSLRITTKNHMDDEKNTPNELPLRKWTQLTFVFHNRSSTNKNNDEEATSSNKIIAIPNVDETPTNQLANPGFRDGTTNTNNKEIQNTYSVYIYFNDQLQLNVSYESTVLPNDGHLYIGKDPWFKGPKCMIGDFKIYNRRLSQLEVRDIFIKTTFYSNRINDVLDDAVENKHDDKTVFCSNNIESEEKCIDNKMYSNNMAQNKPVSTVPVKVVSSLTMDENDFYKMPKTDKPPVTGTKNSDGKREIINDGSSSMVGLEAMEDTLSASIPTTAKGYLLKDLRSLGNNMALTLREVDEDAKTLYDEANILIRKCEEVPRAIDLLEAAGQLNHAEALYLGASLLLHGATAHADDDSKCSELSMGALFNHAHILDDTIDQVTGKLFGKSEVEASSKRAYRLLLKAARLGSGNALWLLGVMHSSGLGIGGSENIESINGGTEIALKGEHETYATALYHLAALHGNTNAQLALAHRYHKGIGVETDCETAAFYYDLVSQKALHEHHSGGQEQIHSHKRLTLETEEHIDEGELGDQDKRIELQRLKAEQGDVPSMLAMGDLYYYGARGLARDQAAAQRWYRMAGSAPHNNPHGQVGVGNMLLKGEGVEKNVTDAIIWYEKAALQNNTRALNGLGFIYFMGGDVSQNQTKGYEYFKRAADKGDAGDSLFNAAHCLYEGQGVEKDVPAAIALFKRAGQEFGHFPSVCKMGGISLMDETHGRKCNIAIDYLRPAAHHGSWGNVVRRGFNNFLIKDYERSLIRYFEGAEMGYEVAQSNAAYILDRLYVNENSVAGREMNEGKEVVGGVSLTKSKRSVENLQRLALHFYIKARKQGNYNHDLRLGDYYYYGMGGIKKNLTMAARYYRKSSANGNAQGAYSLATMYERGELLPGGIENKDTSPIPGIAEMRLAKKYFKRTLDLSPTLEVEAVVQLALSRMRWSDFIRKLFDPSTPWITRSMYKVIIGSSVLFIMVTIIIKLLIERCQANRLGNNDDSVPLPTTESETINPTETPPIATATIASNEQKENETQNSKSASAKSKNTDDLNVMLEYLKSLQNYKRLCATVYLQRWYRKVLHQREKRGKLKK